MTFADNLNEAMAPWQTPDLTAFNNAIATMFDEVEALAFSTNGYAGWTLLMDPVRCPEKWLPWLAQFVGVRLPIGISEDEARYLIQNPPTWRRGQPQAIIDTVKRYLTGAKTVTLTERDGTVNPEDAAYGLKVTISASQSGLTAGTYKRDNPDPKGIYYAIVSVANANTIHLVVT